MFLDSVDLCHHIPGLRHNQKNRRSEIQRWLHPSRMSDMGCTVNYCYSTWWLQVEETEHRATWEGITRAELRDGWLEATGEQSSSWGHQTPSVSGWWAGCGMWNVCRMMGKWWCHWMHTDLTRGASFRRKAGLCFWDMPNCCLEDIQAEILRNSSLRMQVWSSDKLGLTT